ncbi:MAG: hypothetical protein ABI288_01760 [Ginsengibacter sp.]
MKINLTLNYRARVLSTYVEAGIEKTQMDGSIINAIIKKRSRTEICLA